MNTNHWWADGTDLSTLLPQDQASRRVLQAGRVCTDTVGDGHWENEGAGRQTDCKRLYPAPIQRVECTTCTCSSFSFFFIFVINVNRIGLPVNMPDPIRIRSGSGRKHWPEAGRMILAHPFASGLDPFVQTLTQSARTKSYPGWFCTILSGMSVK